MSDQACKIIESSAIRLHNALAKEFEHLYTKNRNSHCDESTVISNLVKWDPSEVVPVRDTRAKSNELLACRAGIDPISGLCSVTSVQLHSYSLTQDQKSQLHDDLVKLGRKKKAGDILKKFADWME